MANVKYGVNIIPRTNNTYTIGNSDYKWSNVYTVQINGTNVSSFLTSHQDISGLASKASPTFTGSLSHNRKASTTVGTNSVTLGDNCEASSEDSYAEGRYTTASGYYSHAEGNYTTASGMASHAEGTVTVANHESQHVFGEYNVIDNATSQTYERGNYVEIVGNGTGSSALSNARALDWSGNEYLKGDLYVHCNASSGSGNKVVAEGNTYTSAEITALQKMLGIYKAPWELIRSDIITTEEATDIEIIVDNNGDSFELTDIIVYMLVVGGTSTATTYSDYGRVRYYYGNNSYDATIANGHITANAGTTKGFTSMIEQNGNLLHVYSTSYTTTGALSAVANYITNDYTSQLMPYVILNSPRYYNKIMFRQVNGKINFKIFGRRKWT